MLPKIQLTKTVLLDPNNCSDKNPVYVKRINPLCRYSIDGLRLFIKIAFIPLMVVVVGATQKIVNLEKIWRSSTKLMYLQIWLGILLFLFVSFI